VPSLIDGGKGGGSTSGGGSSGGSLLNHGSGSSSGSSKPKKKNLLSKIGGVTGGGVKGALDVLDRGTQTVKVLAGNRAHADDEYRGTGGLLRELRDAASGRRKQSFQKAILGEEKVKGAAGFALNFAGDIALDPTTYVSFGTSAAAKVGLKHVAESAGKDVAEEVAKRGAKKVLQGDLRKKVAEHIAAQEGGSAKAADRVLKALDRNAQGGVKVAGHTVIPEGKIPGAAAARQAGRKLADLKPLAAITPRSALARSLGKQTADDVGAAAARARAAASNASTETADRIYNVAKSAKVSVSELEHIVGPALDVGGEAIQVPDHLRPLVDELRAIGDETTQRQLAAGVLPHERAEYLPRPQLTKRARTAINHDPVLAERIGVPPTEIQSAFEQGGHVHARTLMPEAPAHQVEQVIGGKLRDAGALKGPLYNPNDTALTRVAARRAHAERAIAERGFVDELAKIKDAHGSPLVAVAGTAKKALGHVEFDAGPLGRLIAHPDVANEIAKVRDVITNDEALKEFHGLLGKLGTLWKGYATVPVVGGVGFHARNAEGNIFNNFLAGVKNPRDYAQAAKIQAMAHKGGVEALSLADRKIFELAKKHGVIEEGFLATDLGTGAGAKLTRVAKGQKLKNVGRAVNLGSTENALMRSGRSVGSAVETNARLAHFISKLKTLGSADEAARSVKKYLFDYGDLTATERSLKRAIPFWTFMRKNAPLQGASFARQPGKFTAVAHAYQELTAAGGGTANVEKFRQYAVDQGGVPVKIGNDWYLLGAQLPGTAPVEDLAPGWKSVFSMLGGPVVSPLKAGAEAITQKSLFTGNRLNNTGLEQTLNAVFPLFGKLQRSPQWKYYKNDPQKLARLIREVTGLNAVKLDGPPGDVADDIPYTAGAKR
jgi:hypothetical protein